MSRESKPKNLFFISSHDYLQSRKLSKNLKNKANAIVFFVFFLLIWSLVVKVQETSRAQGILVPENNVFPIHQREPGKVVKVFVKDGDLVKKGDPLIYFDETIASSEYVQKKENLEHLMIEKERILFLLEAIMHEKTTPSSHLSFFKDRIKKMHPNKKTDTYEDRFFHEFNAYIAQKKSLEAKKSQVSSEINRSIEAIESLSKDLDLHQEELSIYTDLNSKGTISKRDYLVAQRQFSQTKNKRDEAYKNLSKSQDLFEEAKQNLIHLTASFKESWKTQLSSIEANIKELENIVSRQKTRKDWHTVTAPEEGWVANLNVHSGSHVAPSDRLMELVPRQDNLVLECQLNTKDIPFVKKGMKALVRVHGYDYTRYGTLEGTVDNISANMSTDHNIVHPYYKVHVRLNTNYLNDPSIPLYVGMGAEAHVVTGKRTIFSYLINPIRRSIHHSFHER